MRLAFIGFVLKPSLVGIPEAFLTSAYPGAGGIFLALYQQYSREVDRRVLLFRVNAESRMGQKGVELGVRSLHLP
jgi:hypothetical protein